MITASNQFLPTNTTVSLGDSLLVLSIGIGVAFLVGTIVAWKSCEADKAANSVGSALLVVLVSLISFPGLTAAKDAENIRNLEENVTSSYQVESVSLEPAGQHTEGRWTGTVVSDGYEREVLILEDPVTFEPKIISYDEKIEIPKR